MSKIEILTTTLPNGETVLGKNEKGNISPLRYGNETQALTKIDSIRSALVEIGHRAKVIQEVFTKIVYKDLDKQFKPSRSSFATLSGYRMNPRSRHNHPTNTTDERYYYV